MARNVKSANRAMATTNKPIKEVTVGDSLQNLVAGMNTDRDKRSHSFYGMPRILSRLELENMYRSSWIAKRIINAFPDDMTKEWRRFVMSDDDTNPSLKTLEDAERKLQVKHRFNEAMRWARLYGGALIIIGIKGDRDLSKPLVPERLGKDCLQWIRVIDRWRVSPSAEMDLDLASPHYAMPQSYLIAESSVRVHASRVIRINGQKLPYFSWLQNARWDDSEMQHIFDSLSNNDTISSAIATMMFEANVDVIMSEGLSDLVGTADGENKVRARWQLSQLMKSFNRTLLLDSQDKYDKKSNTFSNLSDVWREAKVDICGASELPFARLFGESPGGLSSTGDGDLENHYGNVGAKQESELRPKLEQFDEVFVRHALGTFPSDYRFEFNPLWVMSDDDEAKLTLNRAQRDQIYVNLGAVTPGLIASELKQKKTYAGMSDEDVEMAMELGQPMHPDQSLEEETNKIIETGKAQTDVELDRQSRIPNQPKKQPNGKSGAI